MKKYYVATANTSIADDFKLHLLKQTLNAVSVEPMSNRQVAVITTPHGRAAIDSLSLQMGWIDPTDAGNKLSDWGIDVEAESILLERQLTAVRGGAPTNLLSVHWQMGVEGEDVHSGNFDKDDAVMSAVEEVVGRILRGRLSRYK